MSLQKLFGRKPILVGLSVLAAVGSGSPRADLSTPLVPGRPGQEFYNQNPFAPLDQHLDYLLQTYGDSGNYCGPTAGTMDLQIFGAMPKFSKLPTQQEDSVIPGSEVDNSARSGHAPYDVIGGMISSMETNEWTLTDDAALYGFMVDAAGDICNNYVPGIGYLVCAGLGGALGWITAFFDFSGTIPHNAQNGVVARLKSGVNLAGTYKYQGDWYLPGVSQDDLISKMYAARRTEINFASKDMSKYGYIEKNPGMFMYGKFKFFKHFCISDWDFECISLSDIKSLHWITLTGYDTNSGYPLIIHDPSGETHKARITRVPEDVSIIGGASALEYDGESLGSLEYMAIMAVLKHKYQRGGGLAECDSPCKIKSGPPASCALDASLFDLNKTAKALADAHGCAAQCAAGYNAQCRQCLDTNLNSDWTDSTQSKSCSDGLYSLGSTCYGMMSQYGAYIGTWAADMCEDVNFDAYQSGAVYEDNCGSSKYAIDSSYEVTKGQVAAYQLIRGLASCSQDLVDIAGTNLVKK